MLFERINNNCNEVLVPCEENVGDVPEPHTAVVGLQFKMSYKAVLEFCHEPVMQPDITWPKYVVKINYDIMELSAAIIT